MERQETIALLHQYVHGDGLIKHCLATEAIMKAVAGFFSEPPLHWEQIGILHDIDFEFVDQNMLQHGIESARLLKTAGIPDDICGIIQCHNHFLYTGTYSRPPTVHPA